MIIVDPIYATYIDYGMDKLHDILDCSECLYVAMSVSSHPHLPICFSLQSNHLESRFLFEKENDIVFWLLKEWRISAIVNKLMFANLMFREFVNLVFKNLSI